jgi:hypothetical protein
MFICIQVCWEWKSSALWPYFDACGQVAVQSE